MGRGGGGATQKGNVTSPSEPLIGQYGFRGSRRSCDDPVAVLAVLCALLCSLLHRSCVLFTSSRTRPCATTPNSPIPPLFTSATSITNTLASRPSSAHTFFVSTATSQSVRSTYSCVLPSAFAATTSSARFKPTSSCTSDTSFMLDRRFNAGTLHPQLNSCFLVCMKGDSIEGIYDTLKQCDGGWHWLEYP